MQVHTAFVSRETWERINVSTKPQTLPRRIFEILETRIIERVFPPGFHLVEDDVASQLKVSRTPVREAFRMLQREGWLQLQPHAGAYVRHPSLEETREVFEVRERLEEHTARLAAERLDDERITALERAIKQGIAAVERKDASKVTSINAEFHSLVAAAAGNPPMRRMLDDLGKRVRWQFPDVALHRGLDSWKEHKEILEALKTGDGKLAGRLVKQHSRRTQEALLQRILRSETLETPRTLSLKAINPGVNSQPRKRDGMKPSPSK